MIDITRETLITLAEAAKMFKPRRGRKVHTTTLWRWAARGYPVACGAPIQLEATYVNGRLCTSREALARFFSRLDRVRSPGWIRSPAATRKAAEAAGKRLEESGA